MKVHLKFSFGLWRVVIADCTAYSAPDFKNAAYVAHVLAKR